MTAPPRQSSRAWYLLPIFLSWVGGLIMFFVLKEENRPMAKKGLILGLILTAVYVVIWGITYAASMMTMSRFGG